MPDTAPDSAAAPSRALRLWAVVLAACAGQFLVVLDVSVVNVALPSMRDTLDLSPTGLQWVVNAYTLTFSGLMLLGGRAADLFGRKRVFLAGVALFSAASLAGGLAREPWHLLAARGIQGVGAAILAPATLTLLTTSVPPGPARTRAVATWSAVGAGGGAAGGLVGGVLTDALSWRWVLLINVPIGVLVLVAAVLWLTESRGESVRRLDVPGALLATLGLGAVAYGIVRTDSAGWTGPGALGPLLAGLALLGLFVTVEARSPEPLVPLRLFRRRAVSSANLAIFINGLAMFAMWYFLSLYTQNVLHYTPLQAGFALVPHSLTIVLGSKTAPFLMARVGEGHLAVLGSAMAGLGYLWQGGMDAGGGYVTALLGPGVLMSLGAGLAATPLATIATATGAPGEAGLLSGLFGTSRTMGGALGLAVLSTVAAAATDGRADPASLAEGYGAAFRAGAVTLAVCVLFMLFALPRDRRRPAAVREGTQEGAPELP
ncbi:MFS transporter [Streptomyces albus subsp. chlorinus]|uniref:MFS transporter n=1 Tax=Streptomyces albus TaxID=1888 RepID=UPI00156FBAC6|nr:MFS transporter [Streptomyces albus]NSC21448.1 MFS transporter [Streptomyces albus subsp. chlorinus]